MSRKLSIMKAAGSLIGSGWESGSECVEAGGLGAGLFIFNFKEGNDVDHEEETIQLPQGKGSVGRWGVQGGRGGVEKVAFCSSSLFNPPARTTVLQ